MNKMKLEKHNNKVRESLGFPGKENAGQTEEQCQSRKYDQNCSFIERSKEVGSPGQWEAQLDPMWPLTLKPGGPIPWGL